MSAVVETCHGRIRGSESGGIRSFQGIPFGAPLTGERRFLPPEPPEPWPGVRDTRRAGPAPQQMALPVFSWINLAASRLGDDCLSLNVWTPALDGARRPVLVWIHGGGFLIGSGSTSVYNGHDLASRGDVVVVTINYRLGALGWVHLSTVFDGGFEQSSNLGLRDQIAALRWVKTHIERFGGDSDNVTVFGQSSGGMSIGALLGAPTARRLFHRAICMSGAADHVLDREQAERVAADFLGRLGGPPASHKYLARLPIDRILQAQHETLGRLSDWSTPMVFLPFVDGDVIPESPLEAIRRGRVAQIPILTGTTLEEWKLFRLIDEGLVRLSGKELVRRFTSVLSGSFRKPPRPRSAVRQFEQALRERSAARGASEIWSAFQTARVFFHPSTRLADACHSGGGKAYSYLFTWRSATLRRALGACHAIDIPFVFGATRNPLVRPLTGLSAAATRLSRKIQDSWIGFARDGSPCDARLPDWPSYEPERRSTMIFGRECELAHAPLETERRLLEAWEHG